MEQTSIQGIFNSIKATLMSFMTEETFVGTNDFVFKRVVDGRDVFLRLKKDGNNIGLKLQVGDLNALLTANFPCACCLPFEVVEGQKVTPHVIFLEDRELLLVQMFKPQSPERYNIEVDFKSATLRVQHANHLSPEVACFACSNTPFMTCGA